MLEYCARDTFQAHCQSHEVVVMEEALYGRFKNGRCMTTEANYCSENVLSWLDDKCSGRNDCDIAITDLYSELYKLTSCTEMPYFKASYICKRGIVQLHNIFFSLKNVKHLLSHTDIHQCKMYVTFKKLIHFFNTNLIQF